jgi:hypothetical protein
MPLIPRVEDHWSRKCGILKVSWPDGLPQPAAKTATCQKVSVWFLMRSLISFKLPNPSSCTMVLDIT